MLKIILTGLIALLIVVACATQQAPRPMADASPEAWREAEKGSLADWVQLTFSDRFVKAGESYFSPDDSKIIFQAVEKPAGADGTPDDFYAMFVGDVVREGASGAITGLQNVTRISPVGSANTCGWFHPTKPNTVIFASTLTRPKEPEGAEHRGMGAYKWPFPREMKIVECDLAKADGTAASLKDVGGDAGEYQAEGSLSRDGRHLLYCSQESNEGDLFVFDLKTHRKTRIVQARGYDGGPFFSPDDKRICYRSDRDNDNLLQLFVADLAFNTQGEIIGIEREYQLTDESCVNWCPYWTRDGRRLIYASSALGEQNFEIYLTDADPGNLSGSNGTIKYGSGRRRITHFDHADGVPASDVLPALSHDGKWMIWTSRRGPDSQVHLWAARFVLDPDAPWKKSPPSAGPPPAPQRTAKNQVVVEDPESGRIFVYDTTTHKLSEYDPRTHQLSEITDPADIELFRKLHAETPQKTRP